MSSTAFKNRYRRRSVSSEEASSITTDGDALNQMTNLSPQSPAIPDTTSSGSDASPINRRRPPTTKNSPSKRLSYVEDGGVEVLETLKLHHNAPTTPTPAEVLKNYTTSRSVDSDAPRVILNRGGSVAKLHNAKLENVVPKPSIIMDVAAQPANGITEEDEEADEDEEVLDHGPFGKRLSLKVPAPTSNLVPTSLDEQDSEEEGGSLIDKWKNRTDKAKKIAEKVKPVTESASVAKARKLQEDKRLQEAAEANKKRMEEIKKEEEAAKAAKVAAQQRYMQRMMKQG
eukprot:m.27074 g.27074  ORF g.27074 m.27074 type:complete len:286 (+) comp15666_c0_seq1:249-1106(+)